MARKLALSVLLAGAGLLLVACAGHKDLMAPCSAAADWWSSTAYAATKCGPMRSVN
ncbi:hypothetical protein [Labrys sp. 22185]|uniref:hypothetical protein n=1 Tax=Labrys sp. 22185 TaxID=3453888 RepID=UPI003F851CB1